MFLDSRALEDPSTLSGQDMCRLLGELQRYRHLDGNPGHAANLGQMTGYLSSLTFSSENGHNSTFLTVLLFFVFFLVLL